LFEIQLDTTSDMYDDIIMEAEDEHDIPTIGAINGTKRKSAWERKNIQYIFHQNN